MKGAKLLPVLAATLLLLASCGGQTGGQTGGDTRRVNASVGTWNYGGQNVGVASIIWADVVEPTPLEGFTLAIRGPNNFSWDIKPLRTDFYGPHFWWWLRTNLVPTSGSYTLSASLPGGISLNRQQQLDATKTLAQPQNITIQQISQNSATFSWSPVSGAKSYLAELWKQEGSSYARYFGWFTTATQVQFTQDAQITLPPGTYWARVFAYNIDFTQLYRPGQAAQLDPQFLVSSAWSQQAVQVQSAGTIQVLNLAPPADLDQVTAQE